MLNKKILRAILYLLVAMVATCIVIYTRHRNETIPLSSLLSPSPEHGHVVIDVGFKTCWVSTICTDSIKRTYTFLENISKEKELTNSLQINHLGKDLLGSSSYIKKIFPYEVKIPVEIANKYKVTPISQFYVENVNNDDTLTSDFIDAGYGLHFKRSVTISPYTDINFIFSSLQTNPTPGWEQVSKFPLVIHKSDFYTNGTDTNLIDFKSTNYHSLDHQVYLHAKKGGSDKTNVSLKPKNGKFKVAQVADLHLLTGFGKCMDPFPELDYPVENCLADRDTMSFVDELLEMEKPDLVILTGDQVFGPYTYDTETALFKAVEPMVKREIPYAAILGNHDHEGSLTKSEIMELFEKFEYSLTKSTPDLNYLINIGDPERPDVTLYMLEAANIRNPKQLVKNFTPQGDFIRNHHSEAEFKMGVFHIPTKEFQDVRFRDPNSYLGSYREWVMARNMEEGLFQALNEEGVKLITIGHDHVNDFCFENQGINLCYGGASGYGGYAGFGGYERRIRLFEFDTQKKEVSTWKRVHHDIDKIVDFETFAY